MLDFDYPSIEIPKGVGLCLDIGCGSGRHRKWIEGRGYKWVGVDIDTSRGVARLLEADACQLPFKSGIFSVVWMNCILEHVGNPWIALSEIYRVTARGGLIAGVSGYLDPDATHMCALSYLGLRKVLTDVGFKNLKIRPATFAFPVILRKYFMYLFGNTKQSTFLAFTICKGIFVIFQVAYLSIGWLKNLITKRSLSEYKKRIEQRNQEIARDFAAYFVFGARKED